MRVLFVEDEEPVRNAIQRAIAWHAPGLEWVLASSLDEALAKLDPALDGMLLDMCLGSRGNTDGLTVLVEARARRIGARAIFLSGQLEFRSMCDAQDLGALVLDKTLMDAREVARRLSAEPSARHAYRNIAKALALKTGALPEHLVGIEDACIDGALEAHDGCKKAAARVLGLPRRQLQRKLERRSR